MLKESPQKLSVNQEMQQLLLETNFRRMHYAAALLLLFQIGTVFIDPRFSDYPYLWYGVGSTTFLCCFFFACSLLRKKPFIHRMIHSRLFSRAFWTAIALSAIPAVMKDADLAANAGENAYVMPASALMYLVLFVIVPLYYSYDSFLLFGGFFIGCAVILFAAGAPISQVLLLFFCSAGGSVLGQLNRQLFRNILQYKSESRVDLLTEILNRRGALEYASRVLESAKAHNTLVASYMVDIDLFKNFNDSYGHTEGDIALFAVAQCLERVCARRNDIVSRYGGEEFWILATVDNIEQATDIAQRMVAAVDALRFSVRGKDDARLSISVGFAVFAPEKLETLRYPTESLVSTADAALYRAKEQGRHRAVLFDRKIIE